MLYYNKDLDNNLSNNLLIQFMNKYNKMYLCVIISNEKTDKVEYEVNIDFKSVNKRTFLIFNKIKKMIDLNYSLQDIKTYMLNLNQSYYNILQIK